MKDKILEILIDKIKATPHDYYPTGIEGLPQSAREIADMVRKFVEWKDWQTNLKKIKHYFKHIKAYRFEGKEMALDELFTYWHKNIYKIKDKEK